jgi:hypothetical protein
LSFHCLTVERRSFLQLAAINKEKGDLECVSVI